MHLGCRPFLSFDHSIYLGNRLSFDYSLGFSQNKTFLDENEILSKTMSIFLKPQIDVFKSKKLDFFASMNIGLVYYDINLDDVPDARVKRQLPQNFKCYTGFSPLGMRIKVSDKISIESIISMWSYESFSIGLKYHFKDNLFHEAFAAN